MEDIRAAADHLQPLDFVDPEGIGVTGICASGGYGTTARMPDKRIKAFAAASTLNIGAAWCQGW